MLFRMLRPDATKVWQNPLVRERLSRYYAIMNNGKIARYLVAKKIPVKRLDSEENDRESILEKLYTEHDNNASKFKSILTKLDSDQTKYSDLDLPEYSFLDLKIDILRLVLEKCEICERRCKKNRFKEHGYCRLNSNPSVSSAFLHHGEESPLVPSGTIFFESCVFRCVFCQNSDISQEWDDKTGESISGQIMTPEQIARVARHLAKEGARNINYVTPTANASAIISSLKFQTENITQLWNSNMYSNKRIWRIILDLMDFHLPDFKYWDDEFAYRMSGVKNYREVISRNIELAHNEGSKEIIIRHLVMPGRIEEDTIPILEWVAKNVPKALVNIMGQYRPAYKVIHDSKYREIKRRPMEKEMKKAIKKSDELGILWQPVS